MCTYTLLSSVWETWIWCRKLLFTDKHLSITVSYWKIYYIAIVLYVNWYCSQKQNTAMAQQHLHEMAMCQYVLIVNFIIYAYHIWLTGHFVLIWVSVKVEVIKGGGMYGPVLETLCDVCNRVTEPVPQTIGYIVSYVTSPLAYENSLHPS